MRQLKALITLLLILLAVVDASAQNRDPVLSLERAATLIREDRLDLAERELSSVLKVAPNEAEALNLLGAIRAKQQRLKEAEILFSRAVRSDNRFVGAHMNLAYLYLLQGAPQKTVSELKEVLRLEPRNTEVVDKFAPLLLAQGQVNECINLIEQAKRSQSPSVNSLVLLGDAYLKNGDADKAEESYLLALGKQSDHADAVIGLAQVSQLRGDAKTASLYIARSRKLVATSPATFYRFALVLMKSGVYDEANAALQSAIKLRPDEPAYFLALGTTWLKKPDLVEAEQAFRRALELQPDSSQGQLYLGYTLLQQKKYPEAREWLEKSLKRDSSTLETFYYLGLIAQEQNEDVRAIELFKKAIQLVPSYSFAHVALGSTYLKLKDYPRARAALELGVKLNPDDPKAHYSLAVLYERIKDHERAQQELQIVEKLKDNKMPQKQTDDTVAPATPNPH